MLAIDYINRDRLIQKIVVYALALSVFYGVTLAVLSSNGLTAVELSVVSGVTLVLALIIGDDWQEAVRKLAASVTRHRTKRVVENATLIYKDGKVHIKLSRPVLASAGVVQILREGRTWRVRFVAREPMARRRDFIEILDEYYVDREFATMPAIRIGPLVVAILRKNADATAKVSKSKLRAEKNGVQAEATVLIGTVRVEVRNGLGEAMLVLRYKTPGYVVEHKLASTEHITSVPLQQDVIQEHTVIYLVDGTRVDLPSIFNDVIAQRIGMYTSLHSEMNLELVLRLPNGAEVKDSAKFVFVHTPVGMEIE